MKITLIGSEETKEQPQKSAPPRSQLSFKSTLSPISLAEPSNGTSPESATIQRSKNYIVGTWQGRSASDIERYLLGAQRKFVKYKLNIFYLNKVSPALFSNLYILNIVRPPHPALLLQQEKRETGQASTAGLCAAYRVQDYRARFQ